MTDYTPEQRTRLLRLAADSIRHGLSQGHALSPDPHRYPSELMAARACFVTLERSGRLRGCIGSLQARRPLIEEVAANAYAAAFSDPRFAPLTEQEFPELQLEISVLHPPQPMDVRDEEDLLRQLRPGIDGLILEENAHRATFLPSVWGQLPSAGDFLAHLKRKAGLTETYWSAEMRFSRYTTESFGCAVQELELA